jgi:hypothetical protein
MKWFSCPRSNRRAAMRQAAALLTFSALASSFASAADENAQAKSYHFLLPRGRPSRRSGEFLLHQDQRLQRQQWPCRNLEQQ